VVTNVSVALRLTGYPAILICREAGGSVVAAWTRFRCCAAVVAGW
jgi:hypothetical protein